jgi:hypothetical protein
MNPADHKARVNPRLKVEQIAPADHRLGEETVERRLQQGPARQVAPTILALLGLDPNALISVQQEGTQTRPGIQIHHGF